MVLGVFSKCVPFKPWNLNSTSAAVLMQPVHTTARLSLPLHSPWETEMWSAQPLLPLARINQCLQIKSEILVLHCLGAFLWRNHWPSQPSWRLRSRSLCLPSLAISVVSPPARCCFVLCTGDWAFSHHGRHRRLLTPAVWPCRFLF